MEGEAPKNEAPKRIDLPVYTGKLQIFLVPWPEDGPGMYRFVERHDQIPRRDGADPRRACDPGVFNQPSGIAAQRSCTPRARELAIAPAALDCPALTENGF